MKKYPKFKEPADFDTFIKETKTEEEACDALLEYVKDHPKVKNAWDQLQQKKQEILAEIKSEIEKEGCYDYSIFFTFGYVVFEVIRNPNPSTHELSVEAMKRATAGLHLFNRLKGDDRLVLAHQIYDYKMDWHQYMLLFCGRDPMGDMFPIDSELDGLQAVYYAHKAKNNIYASEKLHSFPVYEIRINTLKENKSGKTTATIRINGENWTRINPNLARMIIEDECMKVIESNREAYISDIKYVDWFRLGFDKEYFEE